jgi:hypothetical protein
MIEILRPLVKQFMPFAQKRFGFAKPPRMFLKQDEENARNPLGRTAYYDPEQMSITLYTTGRHPKDVMRSLAHELVHHTQNCNGMFDNVGSVGEGYAQNDEHLREMEREAYEQGNLCFRDWEDSIKNTIYFEHLQKGDNVMSTKKWKNKELNTLLNESWGFSMDLSKLSEEAKPDYIDIDKDGDKEESMKKAAEDAKEDKKEEQNESQEIFAPNHYCVHHGGVHHNGGIEMAEAVSHNYNTELGRVTHYDMKLADGTILENVAFEDIQVTNASLAKEHKHAAKRDDKKKCPKCKKDPCVCPKDKKMEEAHCGMRDDDMGMDMAAGDMEMGMDSPEAIIAHMEEMIDDLKRMLGMGDMEVAVVDQPMMEEEKEEEDKKEAMNEAVLRERIRGIIKNVKFKK